MAVATAKRDLRTEINTRILNLLEKGVKPWKRPWSGDGRVKSLSTGKSYQGVNVLLLACHQAEYDLDSNVYGTFNQWRAKGCTVKKGSKGCSIIYFAQVKGKSTTDANGDEKQNKYMLMRGYYVFAADQVEGSEKIVAPKEKVRTFDPNSEADRLVKESGAVVKFGGDRAAYSPTLDVIRLPKMEQFKDQQSYHGTQLHELTHWTGHASRLDRKLTGDKFSESYAFEELIAEMAGCYLMGHCGLPLVDLEQHASYVGEWLKGCKSDPQAIFKAATAASKASDFVLAKAGVLKANEDEEGSEEE